MCLIYAEMVSDKGLAFYDSKKTKDISYYILRNVERPIVQQIFGSD